MLALYYNQKRHSHSYQKHYLYTYQYQQENHLPQQKAIYEPVSAFTHLQTEQLYTGGS